MTTHDMDKQTGKQKMNSKQQKLGSLKAGKRPGKEATNSDLYNYKLT